MPLPRWAGSVQDKKPRKYERRKNKTSAELKRRYTVNVWEIKTGWLLMFHNCFFCFCITRRASPAIMISSSASVGSVGSVRKMLTSPTMHCSSSTLPSAHCCLAKMMNVHSRNDIFKTDNNNEIDSSLIKWQILYMSVTSERSTAYFHVKSEKVTDKSMFVITWWLFEDWKWHCLCADGRLLSSSSLQLLCMAYSWSRVSGSEAVSCCSSGDSIHSWYLKQADATLDGNVGQWTRSLDVLRWI